MEWLKNKTVLLDTNVLIYSSRKRERWAELFELFEKNKCTLLSSDAVRFEFIRCARTWDERRDLEAVLKTIDCLSTHPQDMESATEIASTCSAVFPEAGKRMSLTDSLLSAQLRRYGNRILLATADVQDFPAACFKLEGVLPIEQGLDQQWVLVGFFSFDEQKFKEAQGSPRIKA